MEQKALSVVTYNIHKGFGVGKIRFLLPQMKKAIMTLQPDILFLQEVQGRHQKQEKRLSQWPSSPQFEFIANNCWPYYAYGKNATYQAGHHGNAILSKYPLLDYENINVSKIARASRSLLHGVIEFNGKEIHLLCVHFGLFKDERIKQVATLIDRISESVPNDAPLILAGDFNDWRKELLHDLETGLGLKEAVKEIFGDHAKSFPALRPALQTDRIYFRGVTLMTADCLKGKPWRLLSDHLPLYASFSVETSLDDVAVETPPATTDK